jgi:hypothetical protein
MRREGRQQIPCVISDPILRYDALPVGHRCIVSKCKDAGCRKLGREEGFGPWLERVSGGPCLLAIPGQAVDEDDAGKEPYISYLTVNWQMVHILNDGVFRRVEWLDPGGEGLSRGGGRRRRGFE